MESPHRLEDFWSEDPAQACSYEEPCLTRTIVNLPVANDRDRAVVGTLRGALGGIRRPKAHRKGSLCSILRPIGARGNTWSSGGCAPNFPPRCDGRDDYQKEAELKNDVGRVGRWSMRGRNL